MGTQVIILRRHILSLITYLLRVMILGSLVVGLAFVSYHALLLFVGGMITCILIGYTFVAWHNFAVYIRYDRLLVRRLRFGVIEETIYPIPGRNGLTYYQSLFGKLTNTGTIILHLPEQTVRLSLLTPFSASKAVLGFNCWPAK